MYIVTKFYEYNYSLGQTWAEDNFISACDLAFEWVMDEIEARGDDISGNTKLQREIQDILQEHKCYLFDCSDGDWDDGCEPGKAMKIIIQEVEHTEHLVWFTKENQDEILCIVDKIPTALMEASVLDKAETIKGLVDQIREILE